MADSYTYYKQAKEFSDQNQFEKAAEFYIKTSQEFLKEGNKKNAEICFTNGGLCLYYIRKYNEAFDYYKHALDIAEQLGDLQLQGQVLIKVGVIMGARGDLKGKGQNIEKYLNF